MFALSFPGKDSVKTIYSSFLTQHLKINGFSMAVQKQALNLVDCAISLHNRVTQVFLPTAVKFHYVFNLRDLSNIFQVILMFWKLPKFNHYSKRPYKIPDLTFDNKLVLMQNKEL